MPYIDPTNSSPQNYRLLFENEHVRVLQMTLPRGQKDNEHSHRDETVYFIKGGSVRIHVPDGPAIEADLPDGHVMWHEAWTHTVENVGATDIDAVIVEKRT